MPEIVSIGGGPAGLYASILLKQRFPEARIRVFERNRPDDTFGWGVVFSDETLENFARVDRPTYARIEEEMIHWDEIETHIGGEVVVSTGHGFSGLARRTLLQILHERCRELDVELHFETEIDDPEPFLGADLLLGADGINSLVRTRLADRFEPEIDVRRCKFAWFGTDLRLQRFTFHFKETEHGLFQVHAYPFQADRSTWIVECREEVWRRAGLVEAGEDESLRFCERLFAEELGGHRLLANKSIWRSFPTVKNARWSSGNVVLLGDAAHTAHFSIGSGTKLAMEDAIALAEALAEHGFGRVPEALAAYEEARRLPVLKLQRAAQTSLEWFENSARYLRQEPVTFTFNLMTRSKRITYDNLGRRDPQLVERAARAFARRAGCARRDGPPPPPIFTPFALGALELRNRIVVSPMCQYSAEDGVPTDWHLVHLGSRAVGGAGLVMTEMTDVEPEGRITKACAGLWNEEQARAWRRITDFVHHHTQAKIGVQLAHAGRKGSTAHGWDFSDRPLRPEEGGWRTYGPSALPFAEGWPAPKEMDSEDLARVRGAFVRAAGLALEAGFDLIELHMAHGYLLSSFLSPLSNRRRDRYGGSLENRMRYPLEVFAAVRAAWPAERPLIARISATDWLEPEGFTAAEAVVLARELKALGCALVDVSTAGNVPESKPDYGRMYQVPFADRIRHEAGIPTAAVGAILGSDHANTILAAGRADLVCLARPHLGNPYLTLHAAAKYDWDGDLWPPQYLAGRDRPRLD